MRFRRSVVVVCALAVAGIAAPVAYAAQTGSPHLKHLSRPAKPQKTGARDFDQHTVLVRFKPGASSAARDKALTGHKARSLGAVGATTYVKVHTDGPAADALVALRRDPAVASVSLDIRRHTAATPNDYFYASYQKYLGTVRVPQAWDLTKGSTTQVIAVVDTGVNPAHEDLAGRTVAGYNAITNVAVAATTKTDDNGHGTMVASVAAGNTNNSAGVAGVAWTGRVMGVKVLDNTGSGYDSDIARGVTWAADHGAKVINLSLGGEADDPALHEAVAYAVGKGAVVVAAAGNSGANYPMYPAAYSEVLAVGATDAAGNLTDFSTWGDWVDVAAPGWDVIGAAYDDIHGYYVESGTSFSAPIVAGTAALVRTRYPSLTPAQVMDRIRVTARDNGPRGIDPYYGHGVLDAYNAVGGSWAAEFGQRAAGPNEPNDTLARATALTGTATGSIGVEGDVDWFSYAASGEGPVSFTLTPPAYSATAAQNMDAVLEVYDHDYKLIGWSDSLDPAATEQVTATLAAGTYYVRVANYNGAADSRSYTLAVAAATAPMFDPYRAVHTGSRPEQTLVADVTGDGRNDVVMLTGAFNDPANDNHVFVLAQNADGSLADPVKYALPARGYGLVALDTDGDGRQDVAVSTETGVELLRQTDTGTLHDDGVAAGTASVGRIVAADMNGDKLDDLVGITPANGVVLYTQGPAGTFTASPVTSDAAVMLAVGDLDGDHRPDVVTYASTGAAVHVYHQGDAGWTRTDHPCAVASYPYLRGLTVADVTGDGRADVVAAIGGNQPNSKIDVLAQNAAGGLDAAVAYSAYDLPAPVLAADVTGDGRADVLAGHEAWTTLGVHPQQADGTLGAELRFPVPYSFFDAMGMGVGDFTGDGRPDVALAAVDTGDLVLVTHSAGPAQGGDQGWVENVSVPDFATGVPLGAAPVVTFVRPLDPASVTSSTVRLVDGRTGADVPATPNYDAAAGTVTLTPATALKDANPYRIVVDGLTDTDGKAQAAAYSSTFRAQDLAPGAVSGLTVAGGYATATLGWTLPPITDLDQVIVRMAAGATPPGTVTSGTAAYAGTASGVTLTGLAQGTTYSFAVWAKDRTGHYSPSVTATLIGTRTSISTSVSSLTYGGSVTVTGKLVRADTGAAVAGVPVQLYVKQKGTRTYTLVATLTTSSTGTVSLVHKPAWSLDYEWVYRGSPTDTGSIAIRSVGVATLVQTSLSASSITLGKSVTLSGKIYPGHPGQVVYLQRSVNGVWSNVASRTLPSSNTFSFTIKPAYRGTYAYRVYKPADADHLAGYSATRYLKVS
jgi:type VII secretion-associated serine protease mycosin